MSVDAPGARLNGNDRVVTKVRVSLDVIRVMCAVALPVFLTRTRATSCTRYQVSRLERSGLGSRTTEFGEGSLESLLITNRLVPVTASGFESTSTGFATRVVILRARVSACLPLPLTACTTNQYVVPLRRPV